MSHRDLPRTLTLRDLVLLAVVAILNVSLIPPVALYGRASVAMWVLAFGCFFVPEAFAVLALARRFPGEGGVYLWARRQFGESHGFLSGWCYWINNLFYIPMQLVYIAGVLAFAGGARTVGLVDEQWFVGAVACGWLVVITVANVRGMGVGKWIQNIGGVGSLVTVGLLVLAGVLARLKGVAASPPLVAGLGWGTVTSFSVMCFAFVGIELASTMGDEIHDPERNIPKSIFVAGAIILVCYLLATDALLVLVPTGELTVIQGAMQAVERGATAAGAGWIVAPVALMMSMAIGGGASAWFAGSARVPFVAGLSHALPAALGRVHPRWQSPHVALLTCGVVSGVLVVLALLGSSVAEAYQALLKSAVVIQLVPFIYLFLGLMRLDDVGPTSRVAGGVGLLTTVLGIVAAFIPTADVDSVTVFEVKMVLGSVAPIALGWWLFTRAQHRYASTAAIEESQS
ncbi:MAG: APC family permease [Vicinamibacterales bacterium]